MANELHDHVWVLDTDGTPTGETQLIEGTVFIPTVATDRAVITNGLGDVVFDTGLSPDVWPLVTDLKFRCVNGFTVNVTGACQLYLYGRLE